MAPIITVHRGELLQIKRMIKEGKRRRGDLFGLRTESRQPVIQFVCSQDTTQSCQDMLQNGHGLLKLGVWIVQNSKKTGSSKDDTLVTLVFSEEGELDQLNDHGVKATPDILKGQSAFRLHKPLTKNLPDLSPISTDEYDKENEDKEAQVTKEQWYSAPEGVKLLQEIYKTFPTSGLMNLNISREKDTEDMSLSLTSGNMAITVHFPPYFPYEDPKVHLNDQRDWTYVQLQYKEGMQPEEAAKLLCAHLLNLVNEGENIKRQEQNQSNKNRKKNGKKKGQKSKAGKGQSQYQGQEQAQFLDGNATETYSEPPTKHEPSSAGEHDQDEPIIRQRKNPPGGEQPNQDKPPPTGDYDKPANQCEQLQTTVNQSQPTGDNAKPKQAEQSTKQEPSPTSDHAKPNQVEPTTEQKEPSPTGDHAKPNQGEPTTEQKEPSPTGDHAKPNQGEPTTEQQEPSPTGDHAKPNQGEPITEQEQSPPTDDLHQPNQDTSASGQEQDSSLRDHNQREEAALLYENDSQHHDKPTTTVNETNDKQRQDGPPFDQEQASSQNNNTEKTPQEMEVDEEHHGSETGEARMDVDEEDLQNMSTKL